MKLTEAEKELLQYLLRKVDYSMIYDEELGQYRDDGDILLNWTPESHKVFKTLFKKVNI